jgi:hypothetical protein
LPRATPDRPLALKYRLYFGRGGKCLVRYDNETGKGDHKHVGEKEISFLFTTPEKLLDDFWDDVDKWRFYDAYRNSGSSIP